MDSRECIQFSLDSNKWSKRTLKSSIGGFSQPAVNQIRSLQGLLAVLQPLRLKQFIGSQLYQEEFLGEGISYKVFRCQLAGSHKVVALKQVKLPPPGANIDGFRTRVSCVLKDIEVMNHAPLAAHQGIIDLLGYGWNSQGSIPFLVTECAQHGTMRQLLQGTSLRARQKLKLCRHVASALLELHLCGIAHGDVKLDNVLIVQTSGDGPDCVTLVDDTVVIAKLADFGHSVLLNPGEVVGADTSQKYRGTLAYNAPELDTDQGSDSSKLDFRKCDVWSLGLLCLEALRSGIHWTGDGMIISMISQSNVSSDSSSSHGASWSGALDSKESLAIKMQISKVAISISKKVPLASARISFLQTFRHCLSFEAKHRLADLSSLPLLAPGVYAEIPASRLQLREKVEENHPWSFETLRPIEANTLVYVAKAQIVSDAEASMEQEPAARTAFQIALAHATGYGVPRNHSMFLEWADRSSKLGLSIASLALRMINFNHVHNEPDLERSFNKIVVEAFTKLYHNADRIAGFSLSAELFPAQATSSKGSNSQSNKRASRRSKRIDTIAPHVNTPNPLTGDTPLLAAARVGDLAATEALLDARADPSVAGKDGSVPLHWLFMFPTSSHEQVGQRLGPAEKAAATVHRCVTTPQKLDAQFPIELFGTPLSFAVATASITAVEALLKLGASPTADTELENRTSWHRTPLQLAASLHLDAIFKRLIDALGNTDDREVIFLRLLYAISESSIYERRCIHGVTGVAACRNTVTLICSNLDRLHIEPEKIVLHLHAGIFAAISRADTDVATALVEEFDAGFPHSLNVENRSQYIREIVLLSAVRAHCAMILESSTTLELVKFAIEEGLNIDQFNAIRRVFNSENFIAVAIENQRDDLLKFLKEMGIDICARDPQGRSAFHNIYINKIKWLSAKVMISLGFDVNARDENAATPLHYAAIHGTSKEIEELVSMSALVNARDGQGFTPLHHAMRRCDLPAIHCLLELGADPTIFDKNGRAPIHIAAMNPQLLPVFKILLQSGVSGKTKTKDGESCIVLANDYGNKLLVADMVISELNSESSQVWGRGFDKARLVQQLIRCSLSRLSLPDADGRTPLSYAAQNGLENLAMLLCRIIDGPKVSTRDLAGRTPLSWAAVSGHTGLVEILAGLKPSVIDSMDLDGRRPLSLAAGNGHDETVSELLKHVVIRDARCHHGRTALSWAAGNGHENVVRLLLNSDKDISPERDKTGRSPLSWAAGNGHGHIVRLLLGSGRPSFEQRDDNGRNAISWAAGNGHAKVVEELLHARLLDADSEDKLGRTPLSWAAGHGHVKVAELLLTSGHCNVSLADKSTRSPLSWAAGNGHLAMVKYLLGVSGRYRNVRAADVNGQSSIWWALRGFHHAVAEALIEHDVNGELPEPLFRNQLLLEAVRRGQLMVVNFLLRNNSYGIEPKDSDGRTVLSIAAEAGRLDIFLQLMMDLKTEPNARDSGGRTPLYWAAKGGHLSIVKKLTEVLTPADIDSEADDGHTPLSIAQRGGYVEVVMELERSSPTSSIRATKDTTSVASSSNDVDEECNVKIVVVGEPGALKTRLCYAMSTHQSYGKYDYVPTVFDNHKIAFKLDGRGYKAGLFDTAGQEDYDRLRPLSYWGTDVFLMCFPLHSGNEFNGNDLVINQLRTKWVPEIRRFCPDVPFILVGVLYADETPEERSLGLGTNVSEGIELAKELGALEYLECDTRGTMKGVREVFLAAAVVGLGLPAKPAEKQKSSVKFWRRRS